MTTKLVKIALLIALAISSMSVTACGGPRTDFEQSVISKVQQTSPANNPLCSGNCRLP